MSLKTNLGLAGRVFALTWLIYLLASPLVDYAAKHYPNPEMLEKSAVDQMPLWFIIIVGPILEEIMFRGPVLLLFLLAIFLSNKFQLKPSYLKLISGILIISSGILFGLVHLSNSGIYLLVPIIALISIQGMLYAWLTIKTRSIIWPILLHMLHNLFTTL